MKFSKRRKHIRPKYILLHEPRKGKIVNKVNRRIVPAAHKSLSIHQFLLGPGFHARENLKRKVRLHNRAPPYGLALLSLQRRESVASDGRVQLTYGRSRVCADLGGCANFYVRLGHTSLSRPRDLDREKGHARAETHRSP